QADRARLVALYQARGFFDARVRARRSPATAPAASVALEYSIDRGSPSRLEISGFDVPPIIRQRIIDRWGSAVFDGLLERDAVSIVREHMYREGRFQAVVTATMVRTETPDLRTLRVAIDPGPTMTRVLDFEGASLIPRERLE